VLVHPDVVGIFGGAVVACKRRAGQRIERPPFGTFVALLGARTVERAFALAPIEAREMAAIADATAGLAGKPPSFVAKYEGGRLGGEVHGVRVSLGRCRARGARRPLDSALVSTTIKGLRTSGLATHQRCCGGPYLSSYSARPG
jgi:hypothetical protein